MNDKAQKRGNRNRVQPQDCLVASDIQSKDYPQQSSNPKQATGSTTNPAEEAIDVLSFVEFKL